MNKRFFSSLFTIAVLIFAAIASANAEIPLVAGVTTLGLFGTGQFETNEIPQDWRESVLYLFPNGEAPLTAFLAKMSRETTESSTYNWWEKGLLAKATTTTAAHLNTDVTLTVADSSMFKKDVAIFNNRTNEVMLVSNNPGSGTTVPVTRGAAGSTAAAINNGDELWVIGTVYEEGSKSGSPIYTGPGARYNYTQIFKTPVEITGSANKEKTRTGNKYEDMKAEALRSHSIDMERAFLFGRRHQDTGPNGKQRRWTGGIDTHFIATNRFDAAGTMTKTNFNTWMEQLFSYGSMERLLLAGPRLITVLHQHVQANSNYNITTGETVYGYRLTRLVTPHGDLLFLKHPLFSTTTYLQKYGVILDLANIRERVFRDTDFQENIQDNDADEKKDQFLTETGLEVEHEKTHGIIENAGAYTNT